MEMNSGLCHLFISGKLLFLIIDKELKFDECISSVYTNAQRKLISANESYKIP